MLVLLPVGAQALQPEEILILANRRFDKGVALARYYARRRGIPKENRLLLDLPENEVCTRDDYNRRVAAPVRAYLKAVKPPRRIRCLVLMIGMPLKVAPSESARQEIEKALNARESALKARMDQPDHGDAGVGTDDLARELAAVRQRLSEEKVRRDQRASLDSELSVVLAPELPLGGWIENPFYVPFRNRTPAVPKKEVLMVARLDGPNATSVKRIIDDAIRVESIGLRGIAYFDARWPMGPDPGKSAYRQYDRAIHQTARQIERAGRMPVVVDDTQALFQHGQCPDAALYCGWYSLARYVDAFDWKAGAVGFHIASSECTTLKQADSQVWCKRMIEDGICATIGPVGEPYLQSFPMPELFFGFLTEGVLSLAECYTLSLPFLSWKMVLIGDPLYRPFSISP
ncbi:hypothetical protein DSCO28_27950 [Desulfosarcina ovata subsp. sediminis]|uniref:TIGR03790 family protein n=1 Tax=Desulfosarcina ovata subsp. sediminis TaxID=885957 RepID=A0A5K7ZQ52_9BACT|nr:TIGR03790 family protein [Desulfosarcina ovata]BBO82229.1 hypothetical protein DSCO28_27950 [Desulfosarcina ovata subsp. sediminis]